MSHSKGVLPAPPPEESWPQTPNLALLAQPGFKNRVKAVPSRLVAGVPDRLRQRTLLMGPPCFPLRGPAKAGLGFEPQSRPSRPIGPVGRSPRTLAIKHLHDSDRPRDFPGKITPMLPWEKFFRPKRFLLTKWLKRQETVGFVDDLCSSEKALHAKKKSLIQ